MKYSIRSVFLSIVAVSLVLAAITKYISYQNWLHQLRLTPISIALVNDRHDITLSDRDHFLVDSKAKPNDLRFNVDAGFFNHNRGLGGSGSWTTLPVITNNNTEFSYELESLEHEHLGGPNSNPDIEIAITHSKLKSRVSCLTVHVRLLDSAGDVIDSQTRTVTISDTEMGDAG
jgi:hypothetical protein